MPKAKYREREQRAERVMEMEMELLMSEVFKTVSALKRVVKAREVEVKIEGEAQEHHKPHQ